MTLISGIAFIGSAVGIGIGGVLAILAKKLKQNTAIIYALCSGFILGLILLEIVPESLHEGHVFPFVIGIIAGGIFFKLLDEMFHSFHIIPVKKNSDVYIRMGVLLAISITIHNFPLGIAFGAGQDRHMHDSILQSILLHNIPEGIALFTPFILANVKWKSLIMIAFIVSLPVALGAVLGSMMNLSFPNLWTVMTGLAVGILLLVTLQEMLGTAIKQSSFVGSMTMAGFAFCVIWIYLKLI